MNIAIPKNYQEAQQFSQYLMSLPQEQLAQLINLYAQQGIELKAGKNSFDIFGKDLSGYFWEKNKRGNYTLKDGKSMIMHLSNGSVEYYDENERYHRTDGPAVEDPVHGNRWIIHGTPVETLIGVFQRYVNSRVESEMRNVNFSLRFYLMPLEDRGVIRSFIQFLWDNGYQFDEYLNDYKTKSFDIEHFEPLLNKISPKSENKIMKTFRDFYIADRVESIAKGLSEGDKEENILEAMQNLDLILGKPSLEQIFHNWKSYDGLSEAMSIKKYWSI